MQLKGHKILILVASDYEDMELQYPKFRMQEAGAKVIIAGSKEKEIYKGKHGYPCQADIAFEKVNVEEFSALIIPGGYAPDTLRTHPKVLEIIKRFNESQKLIAFICHAGWLPISAQVIKNIKCTSWPAIKDDLVNAGAHWVDAAVVVDKHFISSRCPDDLPVFCASIIDYLTKNFVDEKKKNFAMHAS